MALGKRPYKGTRDFFPKNKRIQDYMFSMMHKAAQQFGYEPYDGPLLEEVELYKAKSGEELINEQIYSFYDRGKRHVAIRPEMTPTVARMVAQIHKEVSWPIRWYSIPNLMRYEQPQKGRLREHWQFNCDIFGAPQGLGEVEILQIATKLLKSFGATNKHFSIQLNNRQIVDAIFTKSMQLTKEQSYRLYKIVDCSKKVRSDALDKMISELNLKDCSRKIFENYLQLSNFKEAISFLNKLGHEQIAKELEHFLIILNNANLTPYINYDPSIVRGLDYYTGIVFEIFDKHPENKRAICGGGAFANLLQIFNETPMPGVGFGLGDVTLRSFLEGHSLLPNFNNPENDLLITFQDERCLSMAMELADQLRNMNRKIVLHFVPLKFKKVFGHAEKLGCKFVAMMGDREFDHRSVELKNMKSKEQHHIKVDDIDAFIKILNF